MLERVFLCSSSASKGWIAVLTPASGNSAGQDIVVNSSGDVWVVGSAGPDLALVKVDKNATLQWQRRKYTTFAGELFSGQMNLDANDNIYINNSTNTYNGPISSVINKYNASGTFQLSYRYTWSDNLYASDILPDSNGNVYSLHNRDTGEGGGYVQYGIIRKHDSSLDLVWEKYITCTNFPSVTNFNKLSFDASGNIIAAGWIADLDTGANYGSVYKISTAGALVSHKHVGEITSNASLQVDASGNIYVAGYYWNGSTYIVNVMKLNSSYVIQWQRNLAYSSARLSSSGIALDQSGNIYVSTNGQDGTVFIAKYNNSGSLQWQRQFNAAGTENVVSIVHDKVSSFYISGLTNASGAQRHYFAKFPDDGTATGTYTLGGYSYTYSASSLTDSAGSLSTTNLSISIANAGLNRSADNLWFDASGTQTLAVKKL